MMRRFRFIAAHVGFGLALASLSGPVAWFLIRGDSLRKSLSLVGGDIAAPFLIGLVSLSSFGPAYVAGSLVLAGLGAAVRKRPFRSRCFLLAVVGTGLLAVLEVGGIVLLNGRGMPLIQNGEPYVAVAAACGSLIGWFSATLGDTLDVALA